MMAGSWAGWHFLRMLSSIDMRTTRATESLVRSSTW